MKPIFTSIFFLLFATLCAQNRYYVNVAATGANNGQSWADAFTDLQAALQAAQSGDEVWVAEGLYFPTATSDRNISFEPMSGVKLYGGFVGTETSLSQRDWSSHPAVLSGDIGIPNDSSDNVYNVVYLFEPDSSTLLDGFVIRDGDATHSGAIPSRDRRRCGGGLYIMGEGGDAYPDIRNCTFLHNTARAFGAGAMANGGSDGSVAPRFINCLFEQNHALSSGGGVARFGGSWAERGNDLAGCVFLRNRAGFRGGGFYYADTERNDRLDVYGCTFQENLAVGGGGGMFMIIGRVNPSGYSIKSCSFLGNMADDGAAFVSFPANFLSGNYFEMDSCEFIGNVYINNITNIPILAKMDMVGETGSKGEVRNCTFQSNHGWNSIFFLEMGESEVQYDNLIIVNNTSTGSLLYQALSKTSLVSSSIFSGNYFVSSICTNGNVKKAYFDNCVFENNRSGLGAEYIRFQNDTLLLRNCTFANNQIEQGNSGSGGQSVKLAYNCALQGIKNMYRFLVTSNYGEYAHCYIDTIDCSDLTPFVHCGPGNLYGVNPLFRDTANHDYSLLPCSPLINAGSNFAVAGILTDLAGNPRILEGTVDIGAYEAPAFALAAAPQVQPACIGASNGSINIMPEHGCEPLVYAWSPNAGNGPELNGLPPGNYLLTVTDGSGRQILDTVVVASAPQPSLALASTDVQCGTTTGGSLSASVTSGTAPFQYQWLPSASDTSLLVQQQPGDYALTVVDANGCQDSASASIALLGMLTLMVDGKTISCYNAANGWLSASPVTGAAPFSWGWQGWVGTDSIAQPLGPGMYAVTVTDAFGCTAAFTFPTMSQPDSLWATVGTNDQTDLIMPNGTAVVTTISGGTSPFDYLWEPGGSTMQSIAGLTAGTYTVTVTDNNGCEVVVHAVVDLMVGTEEAEGQAFVVYPNPAVEWVKVLLPKSVEKCSVELSDMTGKVLRSSILATSSAPCIIDLTGLPSGNYVVTVRNGRGKEMFVGKVTKM